MILLEDGGENLLPNGHMVINPDDGADKCANLRGPAHCKGSSNNNSDSTTSDVLFVALLRSSRDEETRLSLKVYCTSSSSATQSNQQVGRVYETPIHVPKYSMFAPIVEPDFVGSTSSIKMTFKLDDSSSYLHVSFAFITLGRTLAESL